MLWPVQRLVGMSRVAAIEHPFGRPYGDVGAVATQRAVLMAAIDLFHKAKEPGHIEQLPFLWPEDPKETNWHPAEPSPIIALMTGAAKK